MQIRGKHILSHAIIRPGKNIPGLPYTTIPKPGPSLKERGTFFIFLVILCSVCGQSFAQETPSFHNPRDDQYLLLGLKRAKENYEVARDELDRSSKLFDKNVISKAELEQVERRFSEAEVNYQQQLLSILFENQYITISKAIKQSNESGDTVVTITVENTSSGSAELRKLVSFDEELFETIEPDVINNVYVSILNEDSAIISQPYERKIDRLLARDPVDLKFELLQDLDVVIISLLYGNGISDAKKIYLQKDASINRVEVQSEQFSQEVELGDSASYDLSLELFSGSSDTFKLEVINLPEQINRYFVTPGTETRLSYFKFTESASTKEASLQVFLPDRASNAIIMDQSIAFYVLAIPQDRVEGINLDRSRRWTEQEILDLDVGYVKLDLVPRGIGELLVRAQQLFFTTKSGQSVQVPIELINNGTRSLNNVEVDVDVPLNWLQSVEPKYINRLDVSEENRTIINITPSTDVAVGRYEVRVGTTSLSDDTPIAGEDKIITIEIQAESNILGTVLLLVLILALVGGMVIFGIKLSRR